MPWHGSFDDKLVDNTFPYLKLRTMSYNYCSDTHNGFETCLARLLPIPSASKTYDLESQSRPAYEPLVRDLVGALI